MQFAKAYALHGIDSQYISGNRPKAEINGWENYPVIAMRHTRWFYLTIIQAGLSKPLV